MNGRDVTEWLRQESAKIFEILDGPDLTPKQCEFVAARIEDLRGRYAQRLREICREEQDLCS